MPLLRKLRHYTRLSATEEAMVDRLCNRRHRAIPAREDVVTEGEKADCVTIFESGWSCRYRTLEDGRRQIMALLLPGDVCDLDVLVLNTTDHGIAALTNVTVTEVSRDGVDELLTGPARVRYALQWQQYVQDAIQREWSVNLGQRTAYERMAHLLCETFMRLDLVGLTQNNRCDFPMTQIELAEALGLSAVHVNRVLQELRAENLIVLKARSLYVPDFALLAGAAQFDTAYMHLGREGRHLDAND